MAASVSFGSAMCEKNCHCWREIEREKEREGERERGREGERERGREGEGGREGGEAGEGMGEKMSDEVSIKGLCLKRGREKTNIIFISQNNGLSCFSK